MHTRISVVPRVGITWGNHPGQATKRAKDIAWTTNVVSTEAEFDKLKPEWNSLVKQSKCSVFQTFDWARTWWKHFGSHAKRSTLHIVVIRKNGDVAAIAPLFSEVTSILGLVKTSRLCFIGRRISDYLDIIVRNGMEHSVYPLLANHLSENKNNWDIIFLEDIPNTSATHTSLPVELESTGMKGNAEITEQCPRITLPDSWEEYHDKQSGQWQRKLRWRQKHLTEHFNAEFETITNATELEEAFSEFIELHQYRWNHRGEAGVFADAVACQFHREVVRSLFAKNLVRLSFLRLNGKRVAGCYSFDYGARTSMYLLGMGDAGEAQRFSPGLVLNCHDIRQAIERGMKVFDFMRGVEDYKYKLMAANEPNWTLSMYTHAGKAAKQAQRRRNFNLLYDASRKRATKELRHLATTVKHNGLLSRKTFVYLAHLPRVIIHDARRKARSPLQPLYLEHDIASQK